MEKVPGEFELLEPSGAASERGAGPMWLDLDASARTAALQIDGAAPFRLDLDDVDAVFAEGELHIRIALAGGLALRLSKLGKQRDALLRELRQAYRDHAVDRLRLGEAAPPQAFEGELTRAGQTAPAEIRVFASRIAVLPDAGEPFAQPLGTVGGVRFDERSYRVEFTAGEGAWSVGQLGRQTDVFVRRVEQSRAELHQRAAKALALLLPSFDSLTLRRIGALLPDSGVANARSVDAIKPNTFMALAKAAAVTPALAESIDVLEKRSIPGEAALCIAESRTPTDEAPPEPGAATAGSNPALEGRTIGLVFPVAGGKALAVEVGGHAGKATYVFRASSRPAALLADWAQLDFKREPIYLEEEKLCQGPHGSWRMALRRSAPLQRLRAAFLGRAKHDASWQSTLDALCAKAG